MQKEVELKLTSKTNKQTNNQTKKKLTDIQADSLRTKK